MHNRTVDAEQELLNAVLHTLKEKRGKLIIPAFSLGRTQEIVFTLNKLDLHGLLPDIKIFVDSPLATDATNITRQFSHLLTREVQRFSKSRNDPFGFQKLSYVKDKAESQKLNASKSPSVIISAAGMADAGRVKHHIYHGIEDPKNTILFVGYAEPNSLGGRLQNGAKKVTIFGDEKQVKAEIKVINSLSAHADYQEMILYLKSQNAGRVKKLFLVHGEQKVQQKFKLKLEESGHHSVVIPNKGDIFST